MPHLLVIGYGYSARRLGPRLLQAGWTVSGTRRSPGSWDDVPVDGARRLVFDGHAPSAGLSEVLRTATHLLVSAPPGDGGDPLLSQHAGEIRRTRSLKWVGYLSTTGVYGDHGGQEVTEETRVNPGTERTRRRVEAEDAWRRASREAEAALQIFRLSGIYGPGRSVFDRLRDGSARRIVSPDLVFNRIHVDDIAGGVMAGIDRPACTGVFNVSDDEPAPPTEVVAYAAELMGVDPPPEVPVEEASLSEAASSFYTENKRVVSRRLRSELGYALRYPTYREGLAAVMFEERA